MNEVTSKIGAKSPQTIEMVSRRFYEDYLGSSWDGATKEEREDTRRQVRATIIALEESPAYCPLTKHVAADENWLELVADSFEARAEKRINLVLRPKQVCDLVAGFRRAADSLAKLKGEPDPIREQRMDEAREVVAEMEEA